MTTPTVTANAVDKRRYASAERRMQGAFAFALTCLLVIGLVSFVSVIRLRNDAHWVQHTVEVMNNLEGLISTVNLAESSQRGYVITGDESFVAPYQFAVQETDRYFTHLGELVADNPVQLDRVEALRPLVKERLAVSAASIEARRKQGFQAAQRLSLTNRGRELQDQIRQQVDEMKHAEEGLLEERELQAQRSTRITQSIIVIGSLLAVCFVGFALLAIRRDLAARQKAEAELDRFFTLSIDFLCIASSDGYFKRVSPAITDILGWTVEEFLATPFMELVHPEDREATQKEVEKQVARGERVMKFDNRYRHKDGSWRVLSWRSVPQPGGLMYATARDVTELRHMEQSLRDVNEGLEKRVQERTADLARANETLSHNERRFRALIEHGGDSVSLIDANNRILYLSPAVFNVEGFRPEELVGKSGLERTHPDDLTMVAQIVQKLQASPGKPIPVLWRRQHKDGRWLWLEGVATNLLDDPAVQAIVTNYRDVSERREAEARALAQLARLELLHQITRAIGERQDLRSIFQVVIRSLEEELPVDFSCVCLYEPGSNHVTVTSVGVRSSPLAMELAMTEQADIRIDQNGLSRCVNGQLVYEPDMTVVPFPFPQRLVKGGLRSLVIAPLLIESQVFGVLVAARRRPESFSSGDCEFLKQLSGHVALASHQAQLYTALQRAYDDLRQSQQAVMQQERLRALGQMASGIAHDINNAISPVALYTESLLEKETNLSPSAREKLEIIERAITDVAATVSRLGEFYRQREPQLMLAPANLSRVAQQVIELTKARWLDIPQQRGISIQMTPDLAEGLPDVMVVESEIREALTNLVFNAVDAMPNGGTLTVRTRLAPAAVDLQGKTTLQRVCVEVTDTGVGMDEEIRRRCLEPFFTTKGERGTGLGLAMVYGIIQRHSAEIEIESTPGKGTTMRLGFAVSEKMAPSSSQPYAVGPRVTRLRLLVVDDDPLLLKSVRDALETDGHQVTTAGGGQEGIHAFATAHAGGVAFAAVITDLGMPHVDGRKVAASIKTLSPTTPVIMLTGWGQRLISEGELPPHVDQVLSKPPKLAQLRAALAHCCPPKE